MGLEKENARDKEREDDSFSCRPRKINTKVWEEGEKYDKGTHREGNERLKT